MTGIKIYQKLSIHIFLCLVLPVGTDDNLGTAALCSNNVSTFILYSVDIYSCRLLYLSTFMLITHCYALKGLFHSIRSASDRTQFASDLASALGSEAPFYSKQIRWPFDPGLIWSQSMVLSLCFRKQRPFFVHNLKRKSSLFNSFTIGCRSVQCNLLLLIE